LPTAVRHEFVGDLQRLQAEHPAPKTSLLTEAMKKLVVSQFAVSNEVLAAQFGEHLLFMEDITNE
jgi:hypothetical protein